MLNSQQTQNGFQSLCHSMHYNSLVSINIFHMTRFKLFTYFLAGIRPLRTTVLCEGDPTVNGGFPSQRASNADCSCVPSCDAEQYVEQTSELRVMWDLMALIWRHCCVTDNYCKNIIISKESTWALTKTSSPAKALIMIALATVGGE